VHLVFDTVGNLNFYQMLLRSLMIKNNSSRVLDPSYASEYVQQPVAFQPNNKRALVIESWEDAPVFKPHMRINEQFFSYLLLRVNPEVRKELRTVLESWLDQWVSTVQRFGHDSERVLKTLPTTDQRTEYLLLAKQLRERVAEWQCAKAPSHVQLTSSSLTVQDAIDAYSTMLYYECEWNSPRESNGVPTNGRGPPCFAVAATNV
jgi:hypothetical protein